MAWIRLACRECDRDDFQNCGAIPEGWRDVVFEQAYLDATYEPTVDDPPDNDDGFWWTHSGICPDCWRRIIRRTPTGLQLPLF